METPPQTGAINDESVLVAEAKAGNYAAFEELVNRYEKKIYRLGLNVTGNPEDAEDMLQETFLKAFEHLQDFREDSRFYTWIVRIAINQGLMKLRKRRSSKEVQIEDSSNDDGDVMPREFADWRPNPEQELERTELETILQNAANSLPMTFRTVFFLRDVEGLSTEETAEMPDLSVGPVKDRLFRARPRLREATRELDRLVDGDRAAHAQDDEATREIDRHAFSSYSMRRPSSVRSSSTFSMPFASGAIWPARPPVAMTRGVAGSSATIRASSPSMSPT